MKNPYCSKDSSLSRLGMEREVAFTMKSIILNTFTIILLCLAVLTYILYSWYDNKITASGSSITEKQLLHDVKVIINNELKIKKTEIVPNGHYPDFQIPSVNGKTNKNVRIMIMYTKIRSISNNYTKPYNIQEAMRIWLYLNARSLPYNFEGVAVSTRRSGGFDKLWWVVVKRSEFEELYYSIKEQNLDNKQMISKLADMWIVEHNYQGWWGNKKQ